MCRSSNSGFDPCESLLAQRTGNFAEVLAFAAHRAEMKETNDHGADSTRPTIPVAAVG